LGAKASKAGRLLKGSRLPFWLAFVPDSIQQNCEPFPADGAFEGQVMGKVMRAGFAKCGGLGILIAKCAG